MTRRFASWEIAILPEQVLTDARDGYETEPLPYSVRFETFEGGAPADDVVDALAAILLDALDVSTPTPEDE